MDSPSSACAPPQLSLLRPPYERRPSVRGGWRNRWREKSERNQDELNGEYYSPGYLFNGPRPVINVAPKTVNYGNSFAVDLTSAGTIQSVCVIAPSAVTHGLDMNQRRIPLAFTQAGLRLTVTAPPSPNHAPPGPYMLFAVNTAGVPSIGYWMYVNEPLMTVSPSWNGRELGGWVSGNNASLANSDDNRLVLSPATGGTRMSPNVVVRFGQISLKSHVSTSVVSFESSGPGGTWALEGYSQRSLSWLPIASGLETTAESEKRVEITEDAKRFVHPTTKVFSFRLKWHLNHSR